MAHTRKMPRHEACVPMIDFFASDTRCSGFLPPQE